MAEKVYIKNYRIQRGMLKGVGLKGRHRRLLKREFKKTLRSYVGRPAVMAVGAAKALVQKKIKALPGRKNT
ncbi:MAG: hypothetical protein IJM51_02865 [Clostridia bacterium]|nr:hypothetical protein [Clostridia bacterium]